MNIKEKYFWAKLLAMEFGVSLLWTLAGTWIYEMENLRITIITSLAIIAVIFLVLSFRLTYLKGKKSRG